MNSNPKFQELFACLVCWFVGLVSWFVGLAWLGLVWFGLLVCLFSAVLVLVF